MPAEHNIKFRACHPHVYMFAAAQFATQLLCQKFAVRCDTRALSQWTASWTDEAKLTLVKGDCPHIVKHAQIPQTFVRPALGTGRVLKSPKIAPADAVP